MELYNQIYRLFDRLLLMEKITSGFTVRNGRFSIYRSELGPNITGIYDSENRSPIEVWGENSRSVVDQASRLAELLNDKLEVEFELA